MVHRQRHSAAGAIPESGKRRDQRHTVNSGQLFARDAGNRQHRQLRHATTLHHCNQRPSHHQQFSVAHRRCQFTVFAYSERGRRSVSISVDRVGRLAATGSRAQSSHGRNLRNILQRRNFYFQCAGGRCCVTFSNANFQSDSHQRFGHYNQLPTSVRQPDEHILPELDRNRRPTAL